MSDATPSALPTYFISHGGIGNAAGATPSQQFDRWLTNALVESSPTDRTHFLRNWQDAPNARIAHPAEDHLIPLMVAVGPQKTSLACAAITKTWPSGGLQHRATALGRSRPQR